MTCELMLEALLDAEPSELAGLGDSVVARHVHMCTRCRRVAAELHSDTRLLAHALPATLVRRRASRRTRYVTLAPIGLVAAILVLVVMRPSSQVVVPVMVSATVSAPANPSNDVRADASPVNAPVTRPSTTRKTHVLRAFPPAVAMSPVRLQGAASAALPSPTLSVSVDPPAGTRAVVMHTTNPKLVVVWLY